MGSGDCKKSFGSREGGGSPSITHSACTTGLLYLLILMIKEDSECKLLYMFCSIRNVIYTRI